MNKIEKIKAEIEKRRQELRPANTHKMQVGEMDRDVLMWLNALTWVKNIIDSLEKEPVSNDLEEAAKNYEEDAIFYAARRISDFFKAGAQWQKANLWKDAQGDDLPEIDREVIVLARALPEHEDSLLKVAFAHRPPEYWEGKNIGTGEITRYEPMRYDKGQWNQPAVVWWLDVKLPKEEE